MSNQEIQSILRDFNTNMSCLKEHIHNLSHMNEYTTSDDVAVMVQKSLKTINLCNSHVIKMMHYDINLARKMEEQVRLAEQERASYL